MGRTAAASESLGSYLETFDHSTGVVVGLIIGQASKTTDYVIHLARTPPPPDGEPTKEAETEELPTPLTFSSLKDVNESLLAEHALQVTRMLPGGMCVLGLFLVGSADPFASQSDCSRFRSMLRFIRTHIKCCPFLDGDSPSSEKLLLHFNNQTKIISCRCVDVDGGGSFLQATWKFFKEPHVWQQIECTLDLHQVFHLSESESSPPLRRPLEAFLKSVQEDVKKAVCTIGGELRDADDILENVDKKRKTKSESRKSSKNQTNDSEPRILNANLFLPMLGQETRKEVIFSCSEKMSVAGSIASRVFLNAKATVADAIKAVKQDLVRSLGARVEMHLDSLLEEEENQSGGHSILHEPPRRVMIPLPHASVTLSDYLFPGEGPEEALASSRELLDITIEENDVQKDVECQAESDAIEWDAPAPESAPAPPMQRRQADPRAASFRQHLTIALGVIAVICAVLITVLQPTRSAEKPQ